MHQGCVWSRMQRSSHGIMFAALLASAVGGVDAFTSHSTVLRESTSLSAMPPMIIGPMIRKMREDKEKKKMPMATAEEQKGQAEGLRVGGNAWKWPPVWPYDQEFFTPLEDIPKPSQTSQLNGMASMLSGMPQAPTADAETEEMEVLDIFKYWGEEKATVRTELDSESVEKLKGHYEFYLEPGMSILEFGAAEDSYLPDSIKPSRHVGVSLSAKLMDENPSLTEKLVVDLNKVVPERDVDSDELRKLASEPFDAIIMANTIDFLKNPREVFRTAWYLLKPGGVMIVAFSTKNAYSDKFARAQTKMWRDFNDDQHMWVCGSFFQFSAGDGWERLMGFDISPESAKDALATGPLDMFKQGKTNNLYVVQATKGVQDEVINEENVEKSINSKMWMLPTMEDRDKRLVVPRLARLFERSQTQERKDAIAKNVGTLPTIYEALIKMDQFSFTFKMQSQLAAELVSNYDFTGSDEQMLALKQGLGLRTPSPEFWQPIGENTADMAIEDKINLLGSLVPCFGSGNPDQEAALDAFVTGLKPTFALIRSKCPGLSESDVQLLGTELLTTEILVPGRSTKEEFAAWLGAISENELKSILASRLIYKEEAVTELEDFRAARAAEEKRLDELRKQYQEQVQKARKERSMAFNPNTGKFQEITRETK